MQQINKKLLSWASILEPKTQEQAEVTATMPFITPYMALMPDAHLGLGATVGSVIPTKGAIMPAAVGVDIGCGMIAVKTQFKVEDQLGRIRAELRQAIERSIPLSKGNQNVTISPSAANRIDELEMMAPDPKFCDKFTSSWRYQLGTLGAGNHFIEVSADENGDIWLFLHSGSRGIGNKIAQFYIREAQAFMNQAFITLPNPDLAYLLEDTRVFNDYIRDLRWAQHFALLNREEMMDRVIRDFEHWMQAEVIEQERINCHHNFTQMENHHGQNVWLSRKGAIDAHEGLPGLIPGSMGTASYVVVGKGNTTALCSSPHGAGRNFSRTQARKNFTHEDLERSMTGIEWRNTDSFIDEIPAAYKDIDIVMADASDLVMIRHTLRQLINVKGE